VFINTSKNIVVVWHLLSKSLNNIAITEIDLKGCSFNELFRLLKFHHLELLILPELIALCNEDLVLASRMKKHLIACQLRNLKVSALQQNVTELIVKQGIEVIPFKGPLLSSQLYGSANYRWSSDVDILINDYDLWRADHILKENGYKPIGPDFELSERQFNYLKKRISTFNYLKDSICVELQWRFFSGHHTYPIPITELFARSQKIPFHSLIVNGLKDDDLFLYLCIHGSFHKYKRLFWLSDIYLLLKKTSNDTIENIIQVASEKDMMRPLYYTGAILKLVFGDDIAVNRLLSYLNKNANFKVSSFMMQTTVNEMEGTEKMSIISKIKDIRFEMTLKSNFSNKLRCLYRLKSHYHDWKTLPLHDSLLFLYDWLRPVLYFYRVIKQKKIK